MMSPDDGGGDGATGVANLVQVINALLACTAHGTKKIFILFFISFVGHTHASALRPGSTFHVRAPPRLTGVGGQGRDLVARLGDVGDAEGARAAEDHDVQEGVRAKTVGTVH
jgi:hypothetical protein